MSDSQQYPLNLCSLSWINEISLDIYINRRLIEITDTIPLYDFTESIE